MSHQSRVRNYWRLIVNLEKHPFKYNIHYIFLHILRKKNQILLEQEYIPAVTFHLSHSKTCISSLLHEIFPRNINIKIIYSEEIPQCKQLILILIVFLPSDFWTLRWHSLVIFLVLDLKPRQLSRSPNTFGGYRKPVLNRFIFSMEGAFD